MLDVTRELTEIVEKLLMMARLNPSRLRQGFGPVVISDVLSEVLDVYKAMFEEKSIRLTVRELPQLTGRGDRALIGQAISNAVDNAARFVPEGGSIAVTLQEQDGGALLRICDTGPGIPESMRLGLGGDEGKTAWNGEVPAGRMGLAVASEIMRIHEGKFDLRAHEGGGTCVELTWPRADGPRDGRL